MAYATQDDLVPLRLTQKELIELTDDDGAADQPVAAVVNAALEEASGTIESYCRSRYATPLQVSDVVKARTLDIAVYLLFSRRRNFKVDETVRTRYEDAIAFLKDVASGKVQLDQPATAAPQTSLQGAAIGDRPHTFGSGNTEGFI
jgi:phage gp36-like protein